MCDACNARIPLNKFVLVPEQDKEWTGNQYRVDVGSKLYREMILTLGGVAESYRQVANTLTSKMYIFVLGHKHITLTFSN